MASGEPEGIKSSGISLPQWMKNKATESKTTSDFDAQFASPPAHDDSFFLIRYPNAGSLLGNNSNKQQGAAPQSVQVSTTGKKDGRDWSKHTQPCQQFINGVPFGTLSKCPPTIKPKPAGTDDGFKGEGAACGSSIVRVAQQIISSRSSSRGVSLEPIGEAELIQMSKDRDSAVADGTAYNSNVRRGSKSLPATPLSSPPGSPGSRRKSKAAVNRFFASPFELPADVGGSRSWILAGLLGQQREAINEESQTSLVASVENLGPAPMADAAKVSTQVTNGQDSIPPRSQVFRPKSSELREMNFLSPTSM